MSDSPLVEPLGSSVYASAGGARVAVILGLEPVCPTARIVGPAFTARGTGGHNLALHHAVAEAAPGDVIVLAAGGEREVAHCGEIVVLAAIERGIAAIVVDGAIRDRAEIAALGFPLFGLGSSPRGPGKGGPVELEVPVEVRGATINPGDLVCADADGIVILAAADTAEIHTAALALVAREEGIVAELRAGRTTVDLYGLEKPGKEKAE